MAYSLLIWIHVLAAAAALGAAAFSAFVFPKIIGSTNGVDVTKLKLSAVFESGRWVSRCALFILATGLGLAGYWWNTFVAAGGPGIYGYLLAGKFVMLVAISAIAGIHTAKARRALNGQADAMATLAASTRLRAVAVICAMFAILLGVFMRGI